MRDQSDSVVGGTLVVTARDAISERGKTAHFSLPFSLQPNKKKNLINKSGNAKYPIQIGPPWVF